MSFSNDLIVNDLEESEDEEVYEVERIVGHKRSPKHKDWVEYLIKWKDYDNEFNSWEKEKDVYSKGLINEYWSTQPYKLAAFRSNTHEKKSTNNINPKKRPTPSAVMLEIEKKQKIEDIRAAQITAEPPKGMTWNDISSVNNVFHCGKSTYFAEVKWNKPDTVSYIPTRIIRKNNPLKLINFYENFLDFYVVPIIES